jgi:secreted Zn-dependent insulinase-like peptidase
MQQRQRLANGLWVTLTHDPQASRAAALFHLAAGSHHEPEQWPGLAHLHEHVVFAGSQHYQGDQRLMGWAQAEGARLNATTLPTATAWFFDIPAAKLAAVALSRSCCAGNHRH